MINLLSTTGQIDSNCRYQKPIAEADIVFKSFSNCTKISCELIYGNNPFSSTLEINSGVDYLSFNSSASSAGYHRLRFTSTLTTCTDIQTT